ncbi:GmrSD restriction endonuclease domain-containing protein [Streptomyces hirsutus]|uniref:GmrSD restriction endonuclease domain-containing protein n=1 Tax=Streptomyces hirsutus TaxID=35620 RepID=UPI00368FACF0
MEDLLHGRVVIPSIQRDFVWMRPDVRDLFDSLYRGYPVGALLLWKTNLTVPFKTAAVVQADKSPHQPLYLLDGQQRLTSLAWVYRPESKADGRLIDLRFDVRTQEFVNPSAVQGKDPMLFRVSTLLQENVQYHEVLKDAGVEYSAPDFGEWMQRLQKVHDIRRQQIAVITYESDDYEEVAELFARLNKGGRRLSKGDLVYSAIAARWADGLASMDAFHQYLRDSDFSLDREAVLRLMSLLAGTSARHIKLIEAAVDEVALKEAWQATEKALRLAIDFLREECGIPRSGIMTSPNVIVVPALLLHQRDGKLQGNEQALLRRWVYTAMAFSHYSLQVETKLDAEARLLRTRSGEELFTELIRRASGSRSADTPLHPRDLEQKYSTHAFFRLLYIAALRDKARDWATNIAISDQPMSSGAKIEFHHVFPRARVQSAYAKEEWNSLANLAFVTGQTNKMISSKLPSEYMGGIAPDRLAEQWVPDDPELRSLDRFPEFLAARRRLLANVLNDLLGLPVPDEEAPRRDVDEPPADDELIAEEPSAPSLVAARVQALRTEHGVEVHAVYDGRRVNGYYDPSSRTVTIPSGPGRGEYESPSGAAVAVVRALNPHVSPHRNGWSFWIVTATGEFLQSIR